MTIDISKFKALKVEKQGHVLSVTMNIPERGNPTRETFPELVDIFEGLHEESDIYAMFLCGAGADFSIGLDPRTTVNIPKDAHPLRNFELAGSLVRGSLGKAGHMILLKALLDVPQPIIVAVQGRCLGAAATLALHCDIIYAADNMQLGDTHILKGLVPGDGGAVIWPLLVGPNRAKEYLMTGDLLSGAEAERIGLVNHTMPLAKLQETALNMAKRIANERSPLAVRFTKHAINRVIKHEQELVWEVADAFETMSTLTEDITEAKRSMIEGRKPHFTGR